MSAIALSPKHGGAIQLSNEPVQDSKAVIQPGAEFGLEARKRAASNASTPSRTPQYSPAALEPQQWPLPNSSTSAKALPTAKSSATEKHAGSSTNASSLSTPLPETSDSGVTLGPRLTPQHSPATSLASDRAEGGNSSPQRGVRNGTAPSTPATPRKTSYSASPYHPRASTGSNSGVSGVTSNSSLPATPAPSSFPNSPRQRVSSGHFPRSSSTADLDPTAALIRKLYARLDEQGVPGDGWEEGKERSRDGIINREVAEGMETMRLSQSPTLVEEGDAVLKKVDRYGFFSSSHPAALASQHNRLATLSASACDSLPSVGSSRRTSLNTNGKRSVSAPIPAYPAHADPRRLSTASLVPDLSTQTKALETKRISKWSEMLCVANRDQGGNAQDWALASGWWDGRKSGGGGGGGGGKYRKLQRRIFKGVPDRWRRAVWGLMMEKTASETGGGPTLAQLKSEYNFLVEEPSAQDIQIDLDVPRTISGHVLFHTRYGQGQRALFHVLHAFALHCEDIGGYCQGMGAIAATFLCYFEPERAYAGLVRLFDQYQLKHIFAPGFPGLVEAFYVQERLVEMLMPDVHRAFSDNMISTSSYATKWYITLFANSVPFATQLRFWDGLLLEGLDFLVVTAVAIIWCLRAQFTAADASFESILSSLSSYFFVESDDALLRWIRKTLRMKDVRGKIQDWRREWQGFVKDGSAQRRVT